MNEMTKSIVRLCKGSACLSAAAALLGQTAHAQTIPNPSFEANSFSVAPGFISDNTDITGWTVDFSAGAGLSPTAGDMTFADNGTVPDGQNAAFITGGVSLSTTITGLTAGQVYKVTFQANATTAHTPILRVGVDGADVLAATVYPVSGTAPYEFIAFEFTASAATAVLSLANDGGSDQAVLVDNFTIAASSGRWTLDAWTDDSTSGVDNQYVYTHAYSFGTTAGAVVNGVPFVGVGGANPSVAGKFSTVLFGNVFNGDASNISSALARDFVYSGANVASGSYQTIVINGLTAGAEYVATFYSAGWEAPTTTARWATASVGDDRLTFNQDQFGNDNGIRLSYRYTADAAGTGTIRIAPLNPVNVSIHVYGFSNREAVSRNVPPAITVQPAGVIVSAGVGVDLMAGATGFPVPSFQWRFNGAPITGANTNVYSIAQAASQNVGNYDVIVSNSMGSVTSVVARVVVGLPLANSSFEEDSFISWPGYSAGNPGNAATPPGDNTPITGWTQSVLESTGINPIATGESPFADNGTIPNGKQVAFLQSFDAPVTLSQTVTGLTAGSQYYLHYYENGRGGGVPMLEATLGTDAAIPAHLVPAGGYRGVYSDVFVASAASAELTFTKTSPNNGDTTVLLDSVAIVPVPAGTAPFIIKNPASVVSSEAQTVTFSSQVLGSLPLSYQWLKGGAPIENATNATLTLANLQRSDEGSYALQISNSGGSVTTPAASLTVYIPIAGLYSTGLDNNRQPVIDGEIDPHYELIVNPHIESTAAIVEDSLTFPIVAGPWAANTEASKWIGPEFNTISGAVGLYTYRTTFDLTGRDLASVVILGRWATDNAGRDILVNGVSTGNPQAPGFDSYTAFSIYGTNTTLVAGANTLDFIVENVDAIGYTGLKAEILHSHSLPAGGGGTGARLQITRNANSLSISWTGGAAGQRLQSAPDATGPWSDVPGAPNPYTTTASASRMFYRVAQ